MSQSGVETNDGKLLVAPGAQQSRPVAGALAIPTFLLVLAWFAHFSWFRKMGFYEDDHFFAASVMTMTPHDLAQWIVTLIKRFPEPQGRNLGFALGFLLPYIGYHLGGLPGMFVVGYVIFGLNTLLFYYLLRRHAPSPVPFVAAVSFILYPADTTRPFLCHQDILQPAITFMLLGCHACLSRNRLLRCATYPCAAASLLCYETAVLPLFFIPLLVIRRRSERWWIGFIAHYTLMAAVVGTIVWLRQRFGETRMVQTAASGYRDVVRNIFYGTGIGLRTVWNICVHRTEFGLLDALRRRGVRVGMGLVGAGLATAVVWSFHLKPGPATRVQYARALLPSLLYALATLSISYTFGFTHFPPDFEIGRMTSTHLATTFPFAVLLGLAAALPLLIAHRRVGIVISAGMVAAYFPLLFRASQDEQKGYAAIWQAKRIFWSQVVQLCPDLDLNTIIIVDGTVVRKAYYMDGSGWSDYMVLNQMYDFHSGTSWQYPKLYAFNIGDDGPLWNRGIIRDAEGRPIWRSPPAMTPADMLIPEGDTILLHAGRDGVVTRQTGLIELAGKPFRLKDRVPAAHYPTLPMYHLMVGQ
jgi:hypothetical protein